MQSKVSNNRLAAILSDGFLGLYFIFALFPLLWMVLVSLKSGEELFTTQFVFTPTLENYQAILFGDPRAAAGVVARQEFPRFFMNSLIVSSGAVILSLLVGVPAAYALARYRFRGKEDLAFTFLSFRFAPELVVIIPLSVLYRQLGLYDTYWGIIWVYQLVTLPLLIWVLRSYFEDVSPDIEQAAMIDGYPWWRIFWSILLPLVRPGLAAAALLAFVFAWNNFIFALVLGGSNVQTVTVSALGYISSAQAFFNRMAAASVLASIPQIVLALSIQRYLIRGLSFGAVKG
ncbi:carbohydrate ABC transporter permease [Caldilinea sp.]|jgi:multiple sugar transport system permease protein|uniref:carbohydrate ABC transporter permease n=1 Tax=Caldilinea sp. TaxID=2293560 RepID=UPI0021DF2106|nr:carbohydrate ABC transporter permease [Caldilinea sp.]GIV69361.1 MAG: ABC transporter permease [Caldilinea sp.]